MSAFRNTHISKQIIDIVFLSHDTYDDAEMDWVTDVKDVEYDSIIRQPVDILNKISEYYPLTRAKKDDQVSITI